MGEEVEGIKCDKCHENLRIRKSLSLTGVITFFDFEIVISKYMLKSQDLFVFD